MPGAVDADPVPTVTELVDSVDVDDVVLAGAPAFGTPPSSTSAATWAAGGPVGVGIGNRMAT
jgi:hypothetical protein